ncbi:SdpI family protein [Curtobacterium sp. MCBD17_026]|uniref:SdpI family protein n=1 Tax=Curtobacterium sp. MCBD17_026 TaxID=2175621 RepID=UPI000DA8BB62|nr:SdpI family protein [Curtobacterium sp. MCBD17_026]WIB70302.1 SdpI family protein [Curtobacterium sp. MCBD17_026]
MIAIEMAAAVLTIVFVALPARGIIGRNGLVGIRTRATMRSDESWVLGHGAAIVPTSIAGGAAVVVSLVSIALGRADDVPAFVACAAILVGGALWGVVAAGRATR